MAASEAGWAKPAFKFWLGLCAVLLMMSAGDIYFVRFPDPDDALRLAQVRDLLAGQSWFDLHQYRIDPMHGGVLMHWSRLVDAPLAGLILLLKPLLGQVAAERITMVVIPLVTFGAVLAVVCRLTSRLLGGRTPFYAAVALAVSVPAVAQLRPLRIDHHGWQIVCTMVAVAALFSRSARTGGLIAGASLAVGLSISLEGLPLAALVVAMTAFRWLRDREERAWMLYTMLALGTLSPVLFLATRGTGDLVLHCDIITPVHVAVFAWGALSVSALSALNPRSLPLLLGGFAVIGGLAIAGALMAAPQCAKGAFSSLDPLTRAMWYDHVNEGLPIWHQSFAVIAELAISSLIALRASFHLAKRSPTAVERRQWTEYSLALGGAIAISFLVARAGGTTGALAAMPLGWQIERWIPAILEYRQRARKIAAFSALGAALIPSAPLEWAQAAIPGPRSTAGNYQQMARQGWRCTEDKMPRTVAQLPRGRVLAPLDLGPQLVAISPLTVIATGHHRGNAAMHDVIATFIGSVEDARPAVRAMKADYVMLCPSQTEVLNYRFTAPNGFAAALSIGRAPAWLTPVELSSSTRFKLWRVTG